MAITFINSGQINNGGTAGTTLSGTVNIGTCDALGVAVLTNTSTVTVTTLTWNGVTVPAVASTTVTDAGAGTLQWFALAGPASGSHSLAVTVSASTLIVLGWISYSGVDQTGGTTSFNNGVTSDATSTTHTLAVTTANGDATACAANVAQAFSGTQTPTQDWQVTSNVISEGQHILSTTTSDSYTATIAVSDTLMQSGFHFKAAAGGAAPFNQEDWPVPRGYVYSEWYRWVDNGNTTLPTRDLTKPTNQSDWPNPRAYPRLVDYTWTEAGNVILPIRDLTKPTFLRDFPNPYRTIWYRSVEVSGNSLTGIVQNPFVRTDWPNPPRVSWYQSWTQSFQQTIPFKQLDWPVPKTSQPLLQTWSQSLNTFYQSETFPFSQQDWPNPQRIVWDRFWSQSPAQPVPGTPFFQTDWPLSRTYQPIDQTWFQNNVNILTSAVLMPFSNLLPIRTSVIPSVYTWIQNLLESTLSAPSGTPFFQTDWPLPKTYRPIDQFWTQAGNVQLPFPTPFFQNVDFPLPVISKPIDQTWIQNLAPFFQSNTFPFSQTDRKNPYPIYWYRDHNQNLVINIPVGLKPFNQSDWTLTGSTKPIDQFYYQALVLNLPEPPPPVVPISSGRWISP